jgi:hypothetical protein
MTKSSRWSKTAGVVLAACAVQLPQVVLAMALASCAGQATSSAPASAPPSEPFLLPQAPTTQETPPASEPHASSDQPPAAWQRLVAAERIWRHPDLDGLCDVDHAGFFVPTSPANASTPPAAPSELGCDPPRQPGAEERVTETSPDTLGAAYCCPRSRSAPLPHSASPASCEEAILDYTHRFNDAPPIDGATASSIGAVINHGSFFAHCPVPDSTAIYVCVAVLEGRAAGVTVRTRPALAVVDACIANGILNLSFPSSPRLAVIQTNF